jgi:hypothetical protein
MARFFVTETVTTSYTYIIEAADSEKAFEVFNEVTDRSDANFVEDLSNNVIVVEAE